jgi:hypothetical protein
MNTISIHVPASLAKSYEHGDKEKKTIAVNYINVWLNFFLNSKSANDRMLDIMKETTEIAKKTG